MSPYLVLLLILEFFLARLAMLPYGLDQCYQITCQPVNRAICIFIIMPIVFCNVVSIKCFIVLLYYNVEWPKCVKIKYLLRIIIELLAQTGLTIT